MTDLSGAAPSRLRLMVTRGLTVATSVLFGLAGAFKLTAAEQMVQAFEGFGFPGWFMFLVGAGELGGAIVLLLPPIAFLGGLGLMAIAGGAFVTHVASGDAFGAMVPSIVFFVLAALVTWLRGRDFARPAQQVFG